MAGFPYSYARIWWQSDQLGLQMVSTDRLFFLNAERLIAMHEQPDRFHVVKWRHRNPEQAIACHAGDIIGSLKQVSPEMTLITLYYGEGGRSIEMDATGRLLNVVADYPFCFDRTELGDRVRELRRTLDQNQRFLELKRMTESIVPMSRHNIR